jgi:hypothetical protein
MTQSHFLLVTLISPVIYDFCQIILYHFGKIDGPTVRCDDGVDGDGATVSCDKTASTKAICSIGSRASNILDDDDLGWTVVNRGSNKSKSKTRHKDLCQEVCKSWKAFIGICTNGSGVNVSQWGYFQSWSWSCSNLDLRKVVLCLICFTGWDLW